MNNKGALNLEIVKSVILFLLILGVLVVVLFLAITNLVPVVQQVETTGTALISGGAQNGVNVTVTSKTLTTCSNYYGGTLNSITAINATGGEAIAASNYTLSGCTVTITAASIYKYPLSNFTWNITDYNFKYKESSQQASNIQNNITGGTVKFFEQIPVIFTILGVVVIIAAIVIIISYVSRFGGMGGERGL